MADTFEIRRAVSEDAPDLVSVINAAYAPFLEQGIDLPPVAEGIDDDIATHCVWICVKGETLLGGIVLNLLDGAHIANLAVDPNASGQGIGQALIDKAIDAARNAGAQLVHLTTHADMTKTQNFYVSRGWKVTNRNGNKVEMALMLL